MESRAQTRDLPSPSLLNSVLMPKALDSLPFPVHPNVQNYPPKFLSPHLWLNFRGKFLRGALAGEADPS